MTSTAHDWPCSAQGARDNMCARMCLTRCNCRTACVRLGTGTTRSCKAGDAEAAPASVASRRQEGRGRGCCRLGRSERRSSRSRISRRRAHPGWRRVPRRSLETVSTGGSTGRPAQPLAARGSSCSAARETPAVLRAVDTSICGARTQFGGVQPLRRGGHRAVHGATAGACGSYPLWGAGT